jgi:hypothetical protein
VSPTACFNDDDYPLHSMMGREVRVVGKVVNQTPGTALLETRPVSLCCVRNPCVDSRRDSRALFQGVNIVVTNVDEPYQVGVVGTYLMSSNARRGDIVAVSLCAKITQNRATCDLVSSQTPYVEVIGHAQGDGSLKQLAVTQWSDSVGEQTTRSVK